MLTEIVFILDESGSMSDLQDDTIGGFNSMIDVQKHKEGSAYVSTVLFNNDSKVIHDRVDINEVKKVIEDFSDTKEITVHETKKIYNSLYKEIFG